MYNWDINIGTIHETIYRLCTMLWWSSTSQLYAHCNSNRMCFVRASAVYIKQKKKRRKQAIWNAALVSIALASSTSELAVDFFWHEETIIKVEWFQIYVWQVADYWLAAASKTLLFHHQNHPAPPIQIPCSFPPQRLSFSGYIRADKAVHQNTRHTACANMTVSYKSFPLPIN